MTDSLLQRDIIRTFLKNKSVEEPKEYIKRICSEATANYPVYFYIRQASITFSDALLLIKSTTSRGQAKRSLIERLEGKVIPRIKLPTSLSRNAVIKKDAYRQQWITESIPMSIENIKYCIEALLCLSKDVIIKHEQYIRETILRIYDNEYENATSDVATYIRKAICRIDEALYLEKMITDVQS